MAKLSSRWGIAIVAILAMVIVVGIPSHADAQDKPTKVTQEAKPGGGNGGGGNGGNGGGGSTPVTLTSGSLSGVSYEGVPAGFIDDSTSTLENENEAAAVDYWLGATLQAPEIGVGTRVTIRFSNLLLDGADIDGALGNSYLSCTSFFEANGADGEGVDANGDPAPNVLGRDGGGTPVSWTGPGWTFTRLYGGDGDSPVATAWADLTTDAAIAKSRTNGALWTRGKGKKLSINKSRLFSLYLDSQFAELGSATEDYLGQLVRATDLSARRSEQQGVLYEVTALSPIALLTANTLTTSWSLCAISDVSWSVQ